MHDGKIEIWWDKKGGNSQRALEHNRPDVVVLDWRGVRNGNVIIVDFAVPWDAPMLIKTEKEKKSPNMHL